jgi:hypothetical protein
MIKSGYNLLKSPYLFRQASQFHPKCYPALPELDILENPTLQVLKIITHLYEWPSKLLLFIVELHRISSRINRLISGTGC